MVRLVRPSVKYKGSFLGAAEEFQNEGRGKVNFKKLQKNFSEFIRKLKSEERGKNLPRGYVPQSTYWLIDEDKFIGRVSIRHRLNANLKKVGGHIGYEIRPSKRKRGYGKKVLKSALVKANHLGLKKVLVTCDDNNLASWKIIEANGGILQNKIKYKNKLKRRYWIKIK